MTQVSNEACAVYCTCNSRLENKLKVIQALIDGMSIEDLIREDIAPDLTLRTLQAYYYQYIKEIQKCKTNNN